MSIFIAQTIVYQKIQVLKGRLYSQYDGSEILANNLTSVETLVVGSYIPRKHCLRKLIRDVHRQKLFLSDKTLSLYYTYVQETIVHKLF